MKPSRYVLWGGDEWAIPLARRADAEFFRGVFQNLRAWGGVKTAPHLIIAEEHDYSPDREPIRQPRDPGYIAYFNGRVVGQRERVW